MHCIRISNPMLQCGRLGISEQRGSHGGGTQPHCRPLGACAGQPLRRPGAHAYCSAPPPVPRLLGAARPAIPTRGLLLPGGCTGLHVPALTSASTAGGTSAEPNAMPTQRRCPLESGSAESHAAPGSGDATAPPSETRVRRAPSATNRSRQQPPGQFRAHSGHREHHHQSCHSTASGHVARQRMDRAGGAVPPAR